MSEVLTEAQNERAAVQVAMPDVVRFVRQLSHDLRNHLNAAELQSAYMNEIAGDEELKGELQRLRAMLSEMGTALQRLSASLTPVKLTRMPYDARGFVEDMQKKLAAQFPEEQRNVQWETSAARGQIDIDPQILQQALLELFSNAFRHARASEAITVTAETPNGEFVLRLREPKTEFAQPTENWGREPFRHIAHGHYGLGLHRARSIVEAHDGRFDVRYDPASATLLTTLALPLLGTE